MILTTPRQLAGQLFKLEAGTSSLYQAHGGSLGFQGENYGGWVGAGSVNGNVEFGAFVLTKWRDKTLTFGDDAIPFRLGTDVFDTGHYFIGRGVGLLQTPGATRIFTFVGATSRGIDSPYFRTAKGDKGTGLVFLDHQRTATLSFFSRNVFSNQQTSISGLEWQPRTGVRASVAGGIGANQGYGASSFTVDRKLYSFKGAYILAGERFRRITVQQPISSEIDRENLLFTLRPTSSLAFTAGRQNFLQPLTRDSPMIRSSVNQYSINYTAPGHLALNSTLFQSRAMTFSSRGASFSAGRDVFSRLNVTANYLWNRAGDHRTYSSLLGNFRETISPRLSLLQSVNRSAEQTNVSLGGNFISNRLTAGIEYQTIYLPTRLGNQFRQALVLNFQFRPFGNYSVNVESYLTPDSRVKYTAYGRTYMYRGSLAGTPGRAPAVSFSKHVIEGRVVDEEGKPIRGAVLRVGGEIVLSDSDGAFFLRRRRGGEVKLEVLLSEFITLEQFEVVEAPSNVKVDIESSVHEVLVKLRRIPPGAAP